MNIEGSPAFRTHARTLMLGSLFALGAAVLYGGNVPAARVVALSGMQGPDLIFYRALILIGLLLGLAPLTGTRLRLLPGERRPMLGLALGASLTALLYLTSLGSLPVPLAVVIFYTFPLMIMVATPFVERKPLSPKLMALFALAFAGLVMALGPALSEISLGGAMLAFAAALTNTALFFVLGRGPADEPLRAMFYTQVAAVPLGFAFALAHHGSLIPLSVFANAPWAVAAVIAGYAFGFVLQMMAAQRLAPARLGLLFLAEPATSILVAGGFLGEVLAPLQLLGVALILSVIAAEILLDRA